jgi:hypothetical protein
VEGEMSSGQENSVYKVIEIVGVSSESWEAATREFFVRLNLPQPNFTPLTHRPYSKANWRS